MYTNQKYLSWDISLPLHSFEHFSKGIVLLKENHQCLWIMSIIKASPSHSYQLFMYRAGTLLTNFNFSKLLAQDDFITHPHADFTSNI